MATASISARIDANDKIAFDAFCSRVGMNSSTAINMFIKTVIREQKIPFTIESGDTFFSERNTAFLKDSLAQLKSGHIVTKSFAELEVMEDA